MNVELATPSSPRARRRLGHQVLAAVSALVATVGLAGCASGHPNMGDRVQQRVVHLTNDLAPPADVTVYAVTPDGIRRLLGDVPPNDHRVLRIPNDVAAGSSFHLVADRGLGRGVISQPVTSTTGDLIIDWDLQTNAMWFPEAAP